MCCSLRRKILKREVCCIMTTTLEDMESIPHKISSEIHNVLEKILIRRAGRITLRLVNSIILEKPRLRMVHSFQFKN